MTLLESEDYVTIECRAGHPWTIPRPRRGKWPEYCPEHRRFFLEQLSNRVKPPLTTRQEWAEQGKMLGDEGYSERWTKLWLRTVRMIGARGKSWNAVDVEKVDEYIRARRMAELHRLYAQDEPYVKTAHGKVQPHPGFELAKESQAKADRIAETLGLATDGQPIEQAPPPSSKHTLDDQYMGRLQEEAADFEEVEQPTGPDGEDL